MEVSTSFLSDRNYVDMIMTLNESNTDYIHFDVMDGKFVKNKNLSNSELGKLLKLSLKKNDIHLMVEKPASLIEMLSLYDISYITVHSEVKDYEKYLTQVYGDYMKLPPVEERVNHCPNNIDFEHGVNIITKDLIKK